MAKWGRQRPFDIRVLGVIAVVLAFTAGPRSAEADIDLRWSTIESEHFVIHYHQPLEDVAKRVASLAERAHATLTTSMKSKPVERTHIILRDLTDSSNGFAQTVPRNEVTLFVTAPEGFSQLMDHDDWLYALVVHEYAHIVHLDYAVGLPALVNRVLGKTWAPNQVQPRWVIEGLATYQESKRTSGGRNRFAEFRADLRLSSLTGKDHDIGQISSGTRRWPHGTTAYEYGGRFLKYVFDAYGDDKAADLTRVYGSNPIPWSLNRTFKEVTGKPMGELFDEFTDYIRGEAAMTVEAVDRMGRREGERLTFVGETNSFPRFRRDDSGSVIWRRSDGLHDADLVELSIEKPDAAPATYMSTGRLFKFALAADGTVVFAQGQVYENQYGYRDLVHFDPATRRYQQLTRRLRASEPALSSDGKQVAFVINAAGSRRLAVMEASKGATPRILWQGGRYDQAYEPTWSHDNRSVAFSAWREGGFRDLVIVDVQTGKAHSVTQNRAQDLTPVYDPNGRYLYFASDRSGIYNVYALELDALPTVKLWQVTNVVGGAIQPDISPDGKTLIYQGMVARGYEVYKLALDPSTFIPASPFINPRPDPAVVRDDEAPTTKPRAFRPLETLAPHAYELQLLVNSFGQAASVSTRGADIIGRHRYTLVATLGLEDRNLNVATRYSYNRLWPGLSASLSRGANRRGGFIIDGINRRYTEEQISASVAATLPIFSLPRHRGSLRLEFDASRFRALDSPFDEFDPNEQIPEFPETDATIAGIGVRWSVGSARGFAHTVGPVVGSNVALSASLDHPVFGSDFSILRVRYDAGIFRRLPHFKHVAAYMRLSGGLELSNRRRGPNFTLGGVPDQEIIDSVVNTIRRSPTGYLRGFGNGIARGAHFHLANLELRRELITVEKGIGSLPLYLRRLHVAALFDVGNTWRETVDATDLRAALGGALRLDAVFGYFSSGSFDLGIARGFGEGSETEMWFLLTSTL